MAVILNDIKRIKELREACQNHIDEIGKNGVIKVFIINKSSTEIWGGLGDRDEDNYYCINKDGWLQDNVISEIGQYQRSNSGIISNQQYSMTDEGIQNILNGDCEIYTIKEFINFYDNIRSRYSSEFTLY